MRCGEFSRGEVEFFKAVIQPGWRVADVGANIGAHTVVFSRLVGPTGMVYAFEPQRLIFQMLCANVAINNLDNVYAYQQAIGAEPGEMFLKSMDQNIRQNFGGTALKLLEGGHERIEVRQLTEQCNFLKIDVEGMEVDVLAGAEEMIRKHQPFLFVENETEEKAPALIEKLWDLGYTPRWYITPLFDPDNPKGVKDNIFGQHISTFNLVCQPSYMTGLENFTVADCGHVELMARWAREREDARQAA